MVIGIRFTMYYVLCTMYYVLCTMYYLHPLLHTLGFHVDAQQGVGSGVGPALMAKVVMSLRRGGGLLGGT